MENIIILTTGTDAIVRVRTEKTDDNATSSLAGRGLLPRAVQSDHYQPL